MKKKIVKIKIEVNGKVTIVDNSDKSLLADILYTAHYLKAKITLLQNN